MVARARQLGETGDGYNLADAKAMADPAGYLRRVDELARGINLPAGHVPTHTRWLLNDEDALVGEARLRWRLTDALRVEGGNVGYFVHPDHRRRGHGTTLLRLALAELAASGLARALVTCNADNHPSRRVIEANGGALFRHTTSPRTGLRVATFWIASPG